MTATTGLTCHWCHAPFTNDELAVEAKGCDTCFASVHRDAAAVPLGTRTRLAAGKAMHTYYARKAMSVEGTVVAHCTGPTPRVVVRMDADGWESPFTLDRLEFPSMEEADR